MSIFELFLITVGEHINGNKRNCFNCSDTQTKKWYSYIKEHNFCKQCGEYKLKHGKLRSKKLWFKTKTV